MELMEQLFSSVYAWSSRITWPFPLLNYVAGTIADSIGLRVDAIRIVLFFILNYPFAFVIRLLPKKGYARHAWSAVIGVFMAMFNLGPQWVYSFVSALVCYILMLALKPRAANICVFVVALVFVSISHIHRIMHPESTYDFSAAQMTMTIKLTLLGFNLYDGDQAKTKPTNTSTTANEHPRRQIVLDERARLAVARIPSLIEYLGYMLFFPTVITGPAMFFKEHITTLDGTKMAEEKKKANDLDSTVPALKSLGVGLCFMVVYVVGGIYFPLSSMWSSAATTLGEGFWPRLANLWLAMFFERCKYYFAWTVSEGACILAGFGYNGRDAKGKPRWDKINNMDWLTFELSESPRDSSVRWNRVTGEWLRFAIYDRLPSNPLLQMFSTYTVSAFWHGFFPGYYLFFLSAGMIQLGVRSVRGWVRPYFLTHGPHAKRLYDILGLMVTSLSVAYLGAAFMCLTIDRTLFLWSSVNYIGHVILVPVFLMSFVFPPPRGPKSSQKETKSD